LIFAESEPFESSAREDEEETAQYGEVRGPMVAVVAGSVLGDNNIEFSVQLILVLPKRTCDAQKLGR
jgi:hypothetical protein